MTTLPVPTHEYTFPADKCDAIIAEHLSEPGGSTFLAALEWNVLVRLLHRSAYGDLATEPVVDRAAWRFFRERYAMFRTGTGDYNSALKATPAVEHELRNALSDMVTLSRNAAELREEIERDGRFGNDTIIIMVNRDGSRLPGGYLHEGAVRVFARARSDGAVIFL